MRKLILVLVCFLGVFLNASESKGLECMDGCCWTTGDVVGYNFCTSSDSKTTVNSHYYVNLEATFEGCVASDETVCCWKTPGLEKEEACQEILGIKYAGLIIVP